MCVCVYVEGSESCVGVGVFGIVVVVLFPVVWPSVIV